MRRFFIIVRYTLLALLALYCFLAASAQESQNKNWSGDKGSSQSGLTGAGAGDVKTMAAKSGRAGGLGDLSLGGDRRPLYRLRPSDVAEVTFTISPEFNQTLMVQPDGYVAVKDAGMVYVQGLTMAEFSDAIRQAYRGYLHDPEVAVALKEFEHPYFIVGGEVGRPGKYELRSDTTVAEAVEIAGGLTSQAKHSQVVLFRRVDDDLVETRVLNLKKMLKTNSLREDAHLRQGDLVFVPQNAISKISRFLTKPSMSMYVNPTQF
jgi:polysaccharide export outer membrane protein